MPNSAPMRHLLVLTTRRVNFIVSDTADISSMSTAAMWREGRMVRRSVVWMAMALVLLGRVGAAQTVAIAQISGVVTDESGAALPGVEVQLTQTATAATRFVITDERGAYVLPNLPVGPYTLE